MIVIKKCPVSFKKLRNKIQFKEKIIDITIFDCGRKSGEMIDITNINIYVDNKKTIKTQY